MKTGRHRRNLNASAIADRVNREMNKPFLNLWRNIRSFAKREGNSIWIPSVARWHSYRHCFVECIFWTKNTTEIIDFSYRKCGSRYAERIFNYDKMYIFLFFDFLYTFRSPTNLFLRKINYKGETMIRGSLCQVELEHVESRVERSWNCIPTDAIHPVCSCVARMRLLT